MDVAGEVVVFAPIVALCVGVGLARRGHRQLGLLIVAVGTVAAIALALAGSWRPLLGLIGIAGFLFGLEADLPGNPARRALGMLGIAVGLFALLIAGLYA
jgi:hypothetical protein